jgi:hypothetical protein
MRNIENCFIISIHVRVKILFSFCVLCCNRILSFLEVLLCSRIFKEDYNEISRNVWMHEPQLQRAEVEVIIK